MRFMLAWKCMTLGPKKHEKVAIFRRKMSEFRMFQDFESVKREEIRISSVSKVLLTPTSCIPIITIMLILWQSNRIVKEQVLNIKASNTWRNNRVLLAFFHV